MEACDVVAMGVDLEERLETEMAEKNGSLDGVLFALPMREAY